MSTCIDFERENAQVPQKNKFPSSKKTCKKILKKYFGGKKKHHTYSRKPRGHIFLSHSGRDIDLDPQQNGVANDQEHDEVREEGAADLGKVGSKMFHKSMKNVQYLKKTKL